MMENPGSLKGVDEVNPPINNQTKCKAKMVTYKSG